MTPSVILTETADAAVRETLLNGILRFSEREAGPARFRPLVLLLSDPDSGAVIGGLWGRTSWSFMFVELLYVPDSLRGQGLGSRLLLQAEEEALRRGCRGAWLDTFSFQAPDFYRRLGYTVFGTIEDHPPGHTRYFLQKGTRRRRVKTAIGVKADASATRAGNVANGSDVWPFRAVARAKEGFFRGG